MTVCQKISLLAISVLLTPVFDTTLYSQSTSDWTGGGGANNDFSNSANWSNGVPIGSTHVQFNLPSVYDVNLDQDASVRELNVVDGSVTLLGGHQISLGSGSGVDGGQLHICGSGTALCSAGSNFSIGATSESTMRVENGGLLDTGFRSLFITNKFSLTVSSATVEAGLIQFGLFAASAVGTMRVENSGAVVTRTTRIGVNANDDAEVVVTGSGSEWINASDFSASIEVGQLGLGNWKVLDGASVTQFGSNASLRLAAQPGSLGLVTVSDPGSQWNTTGPIDVGVSGIAILNVLNGGIVSSNTVDVGSSAIATVNVSGIGSELNCDTLSIGGSDSNELNIDQQGVVNVSGEASIGSGGTLNIGSSATFSTGAGLNCNGTINIDSTVNFVGDVSATTVNIGPPGIANFENYENNSSLSGTFNSGQVFICGTWSGTAPFPGVGNVNFEGGVEPGILGTPNQAAAVSFGGDVNFSETSDTVFDFFQLTGPGLESFDQLLVAGDVALSGSLRIQTFPNFDLEAGHKLPPLIEVGGTLSGIFDGFPEGSEVFFENGVKLLITYTGGDGNDVCVNALAVLLGDVNLDGVVNLLDVAPFVNLISSGGLQSEADVNLDGDVDLLDVALFVAIIAGG